MQRINTTPAAADTARAARHFTVDHNHCGARERRRSPQSQAPRSPAPLHGAQEGATRYCSLATARLTNMHTLVRLCRRSPGADQANEAARKGARDPPRRVAAHVRDAEARERERSARRAAQDTRLRCAVSVESASRVHLGGSPVHHPVLSLTRTYRHSLASDGADDVLLAAL